MNKPLSTYWLKLANLKVLNIIASESFLKNLLGKIRLKPSFTVPTAQLIDRRAMETSDSDIDILINPLILLFSTDESLKEIIAHELLHYVRRDYKNSQPDTFEIRHEQDVIINKAIKLKYIELEIAQEQKDEIINEIESSFGIGAMEQAGTDRYRIYTVTGDL